MHVIGAPDNTGKHCHNCPAAAVCCATATPTSDHFIRLAHGWASADDVPHPEGPNLPREPLNGGRHTRIKT
jgi:hypothetical protein